MSKISKIYHFGGKQASLSEDFALTDKEVGLDTDSSIFEEYENPMR